MQEAEDKVKVSWEVSHLEVEELQVMPAVTQVILKQQNRRCINLTKGYATH